MKKEKIIVESLPQEMSDTRSYRITETRTVRILSKKAETAIGYIVAGYAEVVYK